MRVLLIHNRYRTSAPSGEDAAVLGEQNMLGKREVEVTRFDRCNDNIDDSTLWGRTAAAARTIWSQASRDDLRRVVRRSRPDVAHVHNTFSIVSPSIYGVLKDEGIPIVQTLHNFRLFCPGALFLRNGKPCEDCVAHGLSRAVLHRCYRGSAAASATIASMLAVNRALGSYAHIDRFIALTQFARDKVESAGVPAAKLTIKPNFLADPPEAGSGQGDYVVFVGRLLEGKGTETLLAAWTRLPHVKLRIVGDGALRESLEKTAKRNNLNVEFMGMQPRAAVLRLVGDAKFLVVPSQWYEGFPMVIAEAFACGTPVLASHIGSLVELVESGVRGMTFTAGDQEALAVGVESLLADQTALVAMRRNTRAYFDSNLTEQKNYERLVTIYSEVMEHRGRDSLLKKVLV
jgi:glycosyltransferase involved in cell wall biosynthesis